MKKNIFLLLIIFVVVFLSVSCAPQKESVKATPNIPEIYWGEWQTFDANTATIVFEISKEHMWYYAKGYESRVFDACLAMEGAKETVVSEYEYKQEYNGSSISLKYSAETKVLTIDTIYSSGSGVPSRFKYVLKRK